MRYAIRWFKCKLKPPKNEEGGKDLLQMRRHNTQISDLFALSIKSSSTAVLPPFFGYLTEKVKSIHYGDLQPTPVEEIEGTYDPRTGTACCILDRLESIF